MQGSVTDAMQPLTSRGKSHLEMLGLQSYLEGRNLIKSRMDE